VDYRETLQAALVREVLEETGLEVALMRPLFVSDTIDPEGPRHVVNITFGAEIIGGSITTTPADARVEAVDLVDPSDLASLDLRPPMARDLARAVSEGLDRTDTRYLGSLFTPGSDR
jgi:ADP-ribose pyrophosphatase YjhB (NUDIX family)